MNNSYLITKDLFANKFKIMIYGEPGAGKTHLAGTAQDSDLMKNVLFFNFDGGMLTLAERGDIMAIDVRSVEDLEKEVFLLANKDKKYDGIKTVVIDNITELQTLVLESLTTKAFSDRVKSNKNYTIDDVYLEDYGKTGKQLARILRMFRDLPLHVIFIAHKKDKMRKGTQILEESKPALTDKLCTTVMGYLDAVWYLYTQDEVQNVSGQDVTVTERYLLTQPVNNYHAKTRGQKFAQALGMVVKRPNLAEIFDLYTKTM